MKILLSFALLALGCSLARADPPQKKEPAPAKDVLTLNPHPNACQAPPPKRATFLTGKQAREFLAVQKRRAAQSNKTSKPKGSKGPTPKPVKSGSTKKPAPQVRK